MALGFKSGDCTYKLDLCEEHKFEVLNQLIIVYSYGFSIHRRLMTKSFEQPSYLTQVRRLRALAVEVAKLYPFKIKILEFIKYSANAIFKITDTQNKQYVLRINPIEHHTHQAILEEIRWLNHITNSTDLLVPKPVKTIDEHYVVKTDIPSSRFCMVFEWLPGKKRWNSINEQYAYELGTMIAQLQKSGQGIEMQHRNYWLTEGLSGTDKARFYNLDQLTDVSIEEQKHITTARKLVYEQLKQYEMARKDKTGVIHSDVQPNNILVHQRHYSVIDFDECGIGFYGDDLAVALGAFEHVAEGNKHKSFTKLKESLFNGYSRYMPLSEEDIQLNPYFMLARRLMTIAWLEAQKNNPGLRYYYPIAIERAIQFLQQLDNKKL